MTEETIEKRRMRYYSLLRINRDKIDDEVAGHAENYHKVAELHVLAVADYDAIKQELDDATAEEDAEIRAGLMEESKKVTETAIKQKIREIPRIQKLSRELLDAKFEMDRCAVLKESFAQRSYMLKELTGLYIARRLTSDAHGVKGDLQDFAEKRVQSERVRRHVR